MTDPRQIWKVQHSMVDILALSIVAILCGAQTCLQIAQYAQRREEWFRKFLELKNGTPGRLTIERVLGMIDPKQFGYVFTDIMQYIQKLSRGSIISIDGKSHITPSENGEKKHPLYMLHAWCNENSTILAALCIDEKHNEITTIPEILRLLDIKEQIITMDAMGCQKEIVRLIREKKGEYVIGLKENQPTMYREMKEYVLDCLKDPGMCKKYEYHQTKEKGHGRIENREYYLFSDLTWFENRSEWKGLNGVVMVRSTRQRTGHAPTEECRFYITSLTDVLRASAAIRAHWGIENKLHWSLDVLFKEDDWHTRDKRVSANLAILRKLALSFLRKASIPGAENMSGPSKMWACAVDPDFLYNILFVSDPFSS